MMQVTDQEIKQLDKLGLTRLAHILLLSEARSNDIPAHTVDCTFNIDTGDGGEDASIKWDDGVPKTDYVERDSLIQVKATRMPESICKTEILEDSGGLKPKVKALFERGGTYILFCNKDARGDQAGAMRGVVETKGFPTPSIRAYGPTKIAEWVNKYFVAISLVKELVGRPLPLAMQTWRQWSRFAEHQKTDFASEADLDSHISVLQTAARSRQAVVRVCGLPGLGKSRLTIEAFRDSDLNKLTAFVNASGGDAMLTSNLTSWLQHGADGTLVVDNCPSTLHRVLSSIALHADSKLSLITMDSDPDEVPSGQQYIELRPLQKGTIEAILQQKFPGMPPDDLERIAEFAEGYPQMAVLMCEADLRQAGSLSRLTPKEMVDRLLFPNANVNRQALDVISACALFDKFAFDDGLAGETALIARALCANMSAEQFCQLAMQFKRVRPVGCAMPLVAA